MADQAPQKDNGKAPEADAKEKAEPRKPTNYVLFEPGEGGTLTPVGKATALNGKKARAQYIVEAAKNPDQHARLKADGITLVALPESQLTPATSKIEDRAPRVVVG
jgi:hypothetical protein